MRAVVIILLLVASSSVNAFLVTIAYSWDSNPVSDQVTQYLCEYQINDGAFIPCSSNIVPPANTHTETDIDVQSGDVITAHVQACNVVGCSAFSVGVSAIVPPNSAPSAPVNFQILPMVIQ